MVQRSTSEILFDLLKIGNNDDVLDLGCGPGHLTRKIRDLTISRRIKEADKYVALLTTDESW